MLNLNKNKYAHLVKLMRNETKPREKILALQLKKLRNLVHHAYQNVPFYKELYDSAGVKSVDIQTIDDLRFLPTISKKDFQKREITNYLDQENNNIDSLKSIKTSGSSGLSLEFFIDHQYDLFRKAQYLRPYLTNGRKITDHVMRLCSDSGVQQRMMQKIGLLRESFFYANSNTADQIKILKKICPDIVQGYGSELALIAQDIIDYNIEIPKPKIIFTDSETLSIGIRNLIKKAFSADVIDIYGTYETGNIAYECADHCGYHICEDCVIVEYLDQDQNPVQPGQYGELVFTVLNNLTMPFIRYRIGDIGSYSSKPCPCGRTFLLMNKLMGRLADYAICAGGKLKSPTAFIGAFDALANQIREFQVIQTEIKSFEVLVVPKHELSVGLENAIRAALLAEFPNSTILVKSVTVIERLGSGKFKSFVQKSDNVLDEHVFSETKQYVI